MQNEIVVILGRKGQGKTYLARSLVSQKTRVLFYDPKVNFSDCGVVINDLIELNYFLEENHGRNFRVVYQPEIDLEDKDGLNKEFVNVMIQLDTFQDYYVVLDEIDLYAVKGSVLKNFINRGRHNRASIVATTIRYTDVSRNLTAQADKIIAFQTQEESDVKYLKTYFGDLAKDLLTLPPYHHIKYEQGKASKERPV